MVTRYGMTENSAASLMSVIRTELSYKAPTSFGARGSATSARRQANAIDDEVRAIVERCSRSKRVNFLQERRQMCWRGLHSGFSEKGF